MNNYLRFLGPEDHIHKAIIDYIRYQYPGVAVAHPANEGKRTRFEQFKIKYLGVSPGLLDILVFEKRGKYSGLAIEVKAGKNRPTENQELWLERLTRSGWLAGWFNNFDDAKKLVDGYFNLPDVVDILELERQRYEWSLKTFPEATAISSLKKLRTEIDEIEYDLANGERRPEEYADALMCLFDSAGRNGIFPSEIFKAFEAKLAVNKSRTWVKNADNSYSHIK